MDTLSYDLCLGVKKYFQRNIDTLHFLPKINSPWGGVINLEFLASLSYRCYIPFLEKIGPIVFEKKNMLTDDGHQQLAIGHLSDLKISYT